MELNANTSQKVPLVPGAGLEPARPEEHRILSPACLPIPPSGRLVSLIKKRLSSCSKPFWSKRRDSNPRPRPWQGRALPAELLLHILNTSIFKCGANIRQFFNYCQN